METKFNENRTFGVELEVVITNNGPDGYYANKNKFHSFLINTTGLNIHTPEDYHGTDRVSPGFAGWKMERDGSLRTSQRHHIECIEIISPILKGRDGLNELKAIMDACVAYGCTVNRSCGTHVHHGINDLNDAAVKNIYAIYHRSQGFINTIMTPSRREQGFCSPITVSIEDLMQGYERHSAADVLRSRVGDHYKALNFGGFVTRGTVEFRQHAGTVDFTKLKAWIIFTQQICEAAKIRKMVYRTQDASRTFEKLFMTRHYATISGEEVYIEPSDELVETRKYLIKRARQLRAA